MSTWKVLPYWDRLSAGVTVFTPRGVLLLKAPRNIVLFSEQYGYTKTLVRFFAWRLLWRQESAK